MKTLCLTITAILILIFLMISQGQAQDTGQMASQIFQTYTGSDGSQSGLIGGFSVWGLIGGFLFGSIGLVAFIYGKKNAAFSPMIIGLLLMGFPYFVRGTVWIYVVGVALTAALYFFRE